MTDAYRHLAQVRALAWQAQIARDAQHLSIRDRAYRWRDGDDTGLSSTTVWKAMMGFASDASHPLDPGDLSRILRLLELIPEWKPRVSELASLSREWAALTARWADLTSLLQSETGFFGEHGTRARRTYRLMKGILDTARRPK
ncbi:hypothetical protein G6L37_06905 [Agrobacterium rubi]|nr:hypothetical protein [Agrobacterium rubi]NTF25094.1 hypothetical protein [Agrobacterium rubi]